MTTAEPPKPLTEQDLDTLSAWPTAKPLRHAAESAPFAVELTPTPGAAPVNVARAEQGFELRTQSGEVLAEAPNLTAIRDALDAGIADT